MGHKAKVPKILNYKDGKKIIFDKMHDFNGHKRYSYQINYLDNTKAFILLTPEQIETDRNILKNERVSKETIISQGINECAIASMAMLMKRPLEEVKEAFKKFDWNPNDGTSFCQQKKVFNYFGYLSILHDNFPNVECIFHRDSINIKGKRHCLYWNGQELLDPQYNNENVFWFGPEWGPTEISGHEFITIKKLLNFK